MRTATQEVLVSVKNEIEKHPEQNNNLENLAHSFNFSYRYLNRKFSLLFGKTMKQYQSLVKKNELERLLEEFADDESMTVIHFAEKLGFRFDSGLLNFVRRNYNGMSFNMLRKQYQNRSV